MIVLKAVIVAVIGYLLGSANSSLIVGKFYRVDVRKHGSGNAGMTNTLRTLGKTAAVLVIVGDILKGVFACVVGLYIFSDRGWDASLIHRTPAEDLGVMFGGITAIIGHNWPVFFGFKGGKGILTSLAFAVVMDYKIALLLLAVFIVIVAVTRYVSLGSILCAASFPVAAFVFHKSTEFIIFAFILAFLAVGRHHSNIERIIKGNESKLGAKKNT